MVGHSRWCTTRESTFTACFSPLFAHFARWDRTGCLKQWELDKGMRRERKTILWSANRKFQTPPPQPSPTLIPGLTLIPVLNPPPPPCWGLTLIPGSTLPRIVFKDRLMHVSWKWERKNRGHRARFCSSNKTVFYRHWHSCQTSQIRPPQAIRFSSRPLHPMDWTWCSLLNSELWTSSITIRFWSSRGSSPASSQLGRATLQAIHTTGRFSTAAGTSTIIVANRELSDSHATPHNWARRLAGIEMSHFVRYRKKRPDTL